MSAGSSEGIENTVGLFQYYVHMETTFLRATKLYFFIFTDQKESAVAVQASDYGSSWAPFVRSFSRRVPLGPCGRPRTRCLDYSSSPWIPGRNWSVTGARELMGSPPGSVGSVKNEWMRSGGKNP